LNHRMVTRGNSEILQVLVHWSGLPLSLATWEDAEALKQRFPLAPAWGQAGSQDRGSVTSTGTTCGPDVGDPTTAQGRRPNLRVADPEWVR
jgi:hypothetical protein